MTLRLFCLQNIILPPYLFLLLLLLCAPMCTAQDTSATDTVELFKTKDKITNYLKPNGENKNGENEEITPENFYSQFIVSTDDVMVAVTGVKRTTDGDKHVDILTKYITTKGGDGWGSKAIKDNAGSDWKTQFAFQKTVANENKNVPKVLMAAAKEKHVYMLFVNGSTQAGDSDSNDPTLQFILLQGNVSDNNSNGKKIVWVEKNLSESLTEGVRSQLKGVALGSYSFFGSAIVTGEKEKIMFLLKVRTTDDKNITALMRLEDSDTKLKYLPVSGIDENCHFNVFPWGAKIIAVSTDCNNNKNNENNVNKIKESTDMGEKWDECKIGVFCRWEFMKDMKDFTAMNITGRPVLLFTQHMEKNLADSENKKDIYLWLSDGNRMHKVGLIVGNVNITSVSMLYTKGELFSLHQPWESNKPKNVILTHFEKTLENITSTLDAWNKSDKKLITLYQKDTASNVVFITSGLVGFLSGSSKDENKNEWKDEYLYTNAAVNGEGVQNVDGGFTFKGKNAGAKWPVGKPKEDQPYNFTDPGFTLVADVKIENNNGDKKDNSLLGVIIDKNSNKGVGLWCTKDNKLGVTGGETEKDMSSTTVGCNQGEMYQVALVLNANKVLVYVDWEKLKDITKEMKIEKKDNITHFYFGADESQKEVESHATVTNVLLYNRPFTEDEIRALRVTNEAKENEREGKSSKTDKKRERSTNTERDEGTAGGGSVDDGGKDTAVKDDSKNNTEKEETISPSQPEVSVMRVDLLHLLFAVCTAVFLHN